VKGSKMDSLTVFPRLGKGSTAKPRLGEAGLSNGEAEGWGRAS
jgi:hypothetical protein